MAFDDLKKTMETTRAHLQNQYRTKEMENNRLQVQIRVIRKVFGKISKVLQDIELCSPFDIYGYVS